MEEKGISFLIFLKEIPDHRIERCRLYTVSEILLLTFCGVVGGCDAWDDIEAFGKIKLDYLRRYFPYKHGVPSDDTLRRFFRALDPEVFEACFIKSG